MRKNLLQEHSRLLQKLDELAGKAKRNLALIGDDFDRMMDVVYAAERAVAQVKRSWFIWKTGDCLNAEFKRDLRSVIADAEEAVEAIREFVE